MVDARYLLDTNICIYLLKGVSEPARERLRRCHPGEALVSAVTYAEVMVGSERRRPGVASVADRFFDLVPVIDFNAAAALAYARLPFKRAKFDRLIAAHALSRGLILVTNDARDFADIDGLRLENWAA